MKDQGPRGIGNRLGGKPCLHVRRTPRHWSVRGIENRLARKPCGCLSFGHRGIGACEGLKIASLGSPAAACPPDMGMAGDDGAARSAGGSEGLKSPRWEA